MDEIMRKELLVLNPATDRIVFSVPNRCNTKGWIADGKGCGHVRRLYYIGNAPGRDWLCTICGARYPFAFWKVKEDKDFTPTPEREADIRGVWADGKALAENPNHQYTYGKEEAQVIALWSLGPPVEVAAEEAKPDDTP